ncbi:MAG TPA: GNAT family N-acyltransferase [Mesorhizobium sp.]|jgi:putative hemolysin|nr:GNAT family N-acyltransferase [Mesorhizobium sp.]
MTIAALAAPAAELSPGAVLGRIGGYEARLARDPAEVEAAQMLRFRAFLGEGGAHAHRRDEDGFDALCDHLVVAEASPGAGRRGAIVGTYRMLRGEKAALAGGFYSAGEFALGPLLARNGGERFLELGRSCVAPSHRGRGAVEALWAGIWAYAGHHRISVMMGCASFPGVLPAAHARELSFLHHRHAAQGRWRVAARPERFVTMDWMPAEAVDPRAAKAALPALVRGYLRLGAQFGEGCVVDTHFGTTDVFVVLPVGQIGRRYLSYYGGGLSNTRRAA